MNLVFDKPSRKKSHVFIPFKRGQAGQADDHTICLHGRVQHVQCLSGERGWQVVIWVPKASQGAKRIREYDEAILEGVIENNRTWFQNGLDEEKIQKYFSPTMSEMESVAFQVLHEGNHRYFFGKERVTSMEELLARMNGDMRGSDVLVTLSCQGVQMRSRSFCARWKLRSLELSLDLERENSADEDDVQHAEKGEIELYWEGVIEEVSRSIAQNMLQLQRRITRLEEVQSDMQALLERAKGTSGREWNEALEQLEAMVWSYRSGEIRLSPDP